MGGYIVTARVEAVGPRFVGGLPASDPPDLARPADDAPAEFVGPAGDARLGERWDAFRERWSQLTFFLLDGESWRS